MIDRRIRVLQLNRGLNGTFSTTLVIGAKSNMTPLLYTGSLSQAQSSLLYHLILQPFSTTVCCPKKGRRAWLDLPNKSVFKGQATTVCRGMAQFIPSICCVKGTIN